MRQYGATDGNQLADAFRLRAVERRRLRPVVGLMVVALGGLGSGCGNDATSVEANRRAAEPTVSTQSNRSPFTAEQLRTFRDAAAEAPYWYTVRWEPPTTVADFARSADSVIVGTVQSVALDEPRADDLKPRDSPLTLYDLDVVVRVSVEYVLIGGNAGGAVDVRIPVLASGIEGLGTARPAGERIAETGPIGAKGVFVVGDSWSQPVAFESSTGEPVAFLASMDNEVGRFTTTTLAEALADSMAR